MKRVQIPVLFTSESGALSIELSPGKWRLRRSNPQP
jgi:beta-lactamase superfamily II metal-dependent hydrolase